MRAGEGAVMRLRLINTSARVVVVRSAVCSASVTACDAKVGVLVSVVAVPRHRYASTANDQRRRRCDGGHRTHAPPALKLRLSRHREDNPLPSLRLLRRPPVNFLARHPARLICAHSPHLSLAKTSHTHPNTAEEHLAAEPVPVVHGRRQRRSRLNLQLRRHERNTDRPAIWRTVSAVNGGDPEQALTGDSQTQGDSGVFSWHRRLKSTRGF